MKKQYQRPLLQRTTQAGHTDTEEQEAARRKEAESTTGEKNQDIRRAVANPRSARPETIAAMQQTYGNQAVQRLLTGSRSRHTTHTTGPVIQRVIDDRVKIVLNESSGGKKTNELIERYMNLLPAAIQRDLLHLWSKAGKILTNSSAVDRELRILRLCLLVEAARHGISSAFAMKKRAEKECTNKVGIWNAKKIAAFTNKLSTDIQEGEDTECDETYERERERLGEFTDKINKKNEQRMGAINQIVPGLEF